ncbi:MAG: FAD-dependent monooxygenase [Vicinamibacterales bacterium]
MSGTLRLRHPIVVAGGGIGGLTFAVALQRRGLAVRVLERAHALEPAGAGLALQPNAMAVMAGLGLAEAVTAAGRRIGIAAILNERGAPLGRPQDMAALSASFGSPAIALHRARLHRVLQDAVAAGTITLGVEVVDYERRGEGVVVRCADGSTFETELLVGADGLRSKVRRQVVRDGEPTYAGYTSWRGVTSAGRGPRLGRMSESWGRGERFGMVEIGHDEIYWFAVANAAPGGTDRDVQQELLARFGGWHAPIADVVRATPVDRIIRTDISDRDPVSVWHDGPVVLLGDAAHPMTPNLGQGACQAIEDAAVLAEALAGSDTVAAAIRAYEERRVRRANAVVRAARSLGAVAQWSQPVAVLLRTAALRMTPDGVMRRQVQSLWRAPEALG